MSHSCSNLLKPLLTLQNLISITQKGLWGPLLSFFSFPAHHPATSPHRHLQPQCTGHIETHMPLISVSKKLFILLELAQIPFLLGSLLSGIQVVKNQRTPEACDEWEKNISPPSSLVKSCVTCLEYLVLVLRAWVVVWAGQSSETQESSWHPWNLSLCYPSACKKMGILLWKCINFLLVILKFCGTFLSDVSKRLYWIFLFGKACPFFT